jgi:hypothetical protein
VSRLSSPVIVIVVETVECSVLQVVFYHWHDRLPGISHITHRAQISTKFNFGWWEKASSRATNKQTSNLHVHFFLHCQSWHLYEFLLPSTSLRCDENDDNERGSKCMHLESQDSTSPWNHHQYIYQHQDVWARDATRVMPLMQQVSSPGMYR